MTPVMMTITSTSFGLKSMASITSSSPAKACAICAILFSEAVFERYFYSRFARKGKGIIRDSCPEAK